MEQVGECCCYHHLSSEGADTGAGLCVVSEKQGKSEVHKVCGFSPQCCTVKGLNCVCKYAAR